MTTTINDYLDSTISHATLRSQDLIPAFMDILRVLDTDSYKRILTQDTVTVTENDRVLFTYNNWHVLEDDAPYVVEDCFNALEDLAPEGYYFGAIEGDGSDFGFWQIQGDE